MTHLPQSAVSLVSILLGAHSRALCMFVAAGTMAAAGSSVMAQELPAEGEAEAQQDEAQPEDQAGEPERRARVSFADVRARRVFSQRIRRAGGALPQRVRASAVPGEPPRFVVGPSPLGPVGPASGAGAGTGLGSLPVGPAPEVSGSDETERAGGGKQGNDGGDEGFAWTNLTPSSDSKLVYVSAARGSDSNDGLSPQRPVATIAKAMSMIRNGYPDWILLRRGEVFHEGITWYRNGRSAAEPAVLTAYGDAEERPIVMPPADKEGINVGGAERNFVSIVGIHFRAQPTGTSKDGVRCINDTGHDILVEDCLIEMFKNGINAQKGARLSIRGNVIFNNDAVNGGHGQGMFIHGVDDLLVEGNILDHNGWLEDLGEGPTIFKHNAYTKGSAADPLVRPVVRGNIFSRASSFGLTMSSNDPGGVIDAVIENNFFVGNGNGFVHGGGSSYAIVNTTLRGNVFTRMGRTIAGAPQSFGLMVEAVDGGVIEDNLFLDCDYGGETFSVKVYSTPTRASRDVTVRDNVSFDWYKGALEFVLGGASNIVCEGNLVCDEDDTFLLVEVDGWESDALAFSTNAYFTSPDSNRWFRLDSLRLTRDDWVDQSHESDARRAGDVRFADPSRTLDTYLEEAGLESWDVAMLRARKRPPQHWMSDLSAASIVQYLHEGFEEQHAQAD